MAPTQRVVGLLTTLVDCCTNVLVPALKPRYSFVAARVPEEKAKFGVENPNLKTIATMKKEGVEFYVCGQYLAGEKIDPKILTPDVAIAADALLVLMQYQNKGYALMTF